MFSRDTVIEQTNAFRIKDIFVQDHATKIEQFKMGYLENPDGGSDASDNLRFVNGGGDV